MSPWSQLVQRKASVTVTATKTTCSATCWPSPATAVPRLPVPLLLHSYSSPGLPKQGCGVCEVCLDPGLLHLPCLREDLLAGVTQAQCSDPHVRPQAAAAGRKRAYAGKSHGHVARNTLDQLLVGVEWIRQQHLIRQQQPWPTHLSTLGTAPTGLAAARVMAAAMAQPDKVAGPGTPAGYAPVVMEHAARYQPDSLAAELDPHGSLLAHSGDKVQELATRVSAAAVSGEPYLAFTPIVHRNQIQPPVQPDTLQRK
ncbi:hypothetical protein V8C86DRAFT_3024650 [Haematococcus lacustris]